MTVPPRVLFAALGLLLAASPAFANDAARVRAAKALDHEGYRPAWSALRAVTETEPNDDSGSANPITLDGAIDGAVTDTVDQDWFTLTAGAGSYLTVSTSPVGAEVADTVLEAFGSDGVTRIALDDDSGIGLFSALEHLLVPGDGTVLFRVTRYSALGDPDYRLVAEAGTAPPPVPANDTPQFARFLEVCNTAVTGSNIGATGNVMEVECLDTDPLGGDVFYRVVVPFSYELRVLVEPTEAWDLSVFLFTDAADPRGSCTDATDDAYAGEAELASYINELLPAQDRELYIGVDSWASWSDGNFILSTSCDFVVENEAASFSTLKARFQGD